MAVEIAVTPGWKVIEGKTAKPGLKNGELCIRVILVIDSKANYRRMLFESSILLHIVEK